MFGLVISVVCFVASKFCHMFGIYILCMFGSTWPGQCMNTNCAPPAASLHVVKHVLWVAEKSLPNKEQCSKVMSCALTFARLCSRHLGGQVGWFVV